LKNIKVSIPNKNYDIKIESGLFGKIGELIKDIYGGVKFSSLLIEILMSFTGKSLILI